MIPQPQVVNVSRPTFLELSNVIAAAGLQAMFTDDGDIHCGPLTIHTEDNLPQHDRLAAAIDEEARTHPSVENGSGAVYDDGQVALYTRSRHDGVHVTECRAGLDPNIVTVPRAALHLLSSDLIECIARPPE